MNQVIDEIRGNDPQNPQLPSVDDIHQNPVDGAGADLPQNPVEPAELNVKSLANDADFIDIAARYMESFVDGINSLTDWIPELAENIANALRTMFNNAGNPQMIQILQMFGIIQDVLNVHEDIVNHNVDAESNPVSRAVGNLERHIEEDGQPPEIENVGVEEPLIPADDFMNARNQHNRIMDNFWLHNDFMVNLTQIFRSSRLDRVNFTRLVEVQNNNASHVERVLNLVRNFQNLRNRAEMMGYARFSDAFFASLDMFHHHIGNGATNNRVFDGLLRENNDAGMYFWENQYRAALAEFNQVLSSTGLSADYVNGPRNVSSILIDNINTLLSSMGPSFDVDSSLRDRFVSLRSDYQTTLSASGGPDLDVLLIVYFGLLQLNSEVNINLTEYEDMISFDYENLLKKNIYNGIFNRLVNQVLGLEDTPRRLANVFLQDLRLLRSISMDAFSNVTRGVDFNGIPIYEALEQIDNGQLVAFNNLTSAERMRFLVDAYRRISDALDASYRDPINQTISARDFAFHRIKYEGSYSRDIYQRLSDDEKILVNKYLYDKCCSLLPSYNGIHYYKGLRDLTRDMVGLSNINNVSGAYFNRLNLVYRILMSSQSSDNLFNRDIFNLSSTQIANIIVDDLKELYSINYHLSADTFPNALRDKDFFANIINLGNNNSIDALKSLYNQYRYLREQLVIYKQLEYCFDYLAN